jgi:hypothetical protein
MFHNMTQISAKGRGKSVNRLADSNDPPERLTVHRRIENRGAFGSVHRACAKGWNNKRAALKAAQRKKRTQRS